MRKNKSPKISIIVPCYNHSCFIHECLDSIVQQTYQDWECIVVDDGSTDDIRAVMELWLQKDARISFYSKNNGGLVSSRNYGIEKSNGEWILPLDADDKIGREYMALAVDNMRSGVELIYCDAEFFGARTGKWELESYCYEKLILKNLIFCSALFKKSSWESVGKYDINMLYGYEDWDLWIRLLNSHREGVVKLDYRGFYYRRSEDSMSIQLNRHEERMKYTLDYILDKHRTIYEELYPYNIPLLRSAKENEKILLKIKNQLGKNIITRILYVIIRKF